MFRSGERSGWTSSRWRGVTVALLLLMLLTTLNGSAVPFAAPLAQADEAEWPIMLYSVADDEVLEESTSSISTSSGWGTSLTIDTVAAASISSPIISMPRMLH
jgi:hypothetical protein